MANNDLIARIFASRDWGGNAGRAIQASSRYVLQSAQLQVQSSRDPLERTPDPPAPLDDYGSCLELRLSAIPRTRHGLVFGSAPNSDVVLPYHGISWHHFTLTFDDARRLIIKDWGSLWGTEVTYDDQGHGKRSGFQWIIGGDPTAREKQEIIITVRQDIQFQIIVTPYKTESQAHIDQVDRFRKGTATTEDLFHDLDIPNRLETKRPTSAHTPGTGEIHLRRKLGDGGFATVTHFWNVRTGDQFALKEPSAKAVRKRQVNVNAWRNEAHIMGLISHDAHVRMSLQLSVAVILTSQQPHIVTLLAVDFTRWPQLHLEYVPEGSLDDQQNVTATESVSVLCQCLSALAYLHGHDPPIVHRDIKPANVLIQQRNLGSIYVKLGDFGLSKDYDNLSTICGTFAYLAPEIYRNKQYADAGGSERRSYTAAVDIWSLGVVVYELVYRLPQWKEEYRGRGTVWCERIVERFQQDSKKRPDKLREFLLNTMVILSPYLRHPAQDCYDQAVLLPVALPSTAEERCATPRPVSHVDASDETTIHYRAGSGTVNRLQTIVWQPSLFEGGSATGHSLSNYTQESLTPQASKELIQGRLASNQDHPVDDDNGVGTFQPIDSQVSSRGLELNYLLADNAHGLFDPHNLGECDQDWTLPNHALELFPDQPCHAFNEGQIEYDAATQEAVGTADLLQAMGQGPHAGARNQVGRAPCPQKLSELSHISFREVLSDRPGLLYMVIRRQAISMRKDDCQLNASEILTAANVQKTRRTEYTRTLKDHHVSTRLPSQGGLQIWVPFREGVFLCQAVGLQDDLKPLLSRAPLALPKQEENYFLLPKKSRFPKRHLSSRGPLSPGRPRRRQLGEEPTQGYAGLQCGDQVIVYRPVERTVNATHLIKLGGIPRQRLAAFFAKNPTITKKARHGNGNLQGTYIPYKDAQVLSTHFDLDPSPVKRLIELASVPSGSISGEEVPDDTEEAIEEDRVVNLSASSEARIETVPQDLDSLPELNQISGGISNADSCFTEANYENGSYLAPPGQSYLELLDSRSSLEIPVRIDEAEDTWMTSGGKVLPMEFAAVPALAGTSAPSAAFVQEFLSVLANNGCEGLFGIDTLAKNNWSEMKIGDASVVVPSDDSETYSQDKFFPVAFAFDKGKPEFKIHGKVRQGPQALVEA